MEDTMTNEMLFRYTASFNNVHYIRLIVGERVMSLTVGDTPLCLSNDFNKSPEFRNDMLKVTTAKAAMSVIRKYIKYDYANTLVAL
jgi:hypothetical protein